MSQNTLLASRLDALTPVADTFCAVGSVSLAGRGHFQDDICLVGDSAQVIAPFCGDGMAMALLSGGMAAQLASQFVNGEISRTTFMQRYIKEWKWRFGLRIAIGQTLQSLILSPVVASVMLSVVNRFPATGNWLVVHTRSTSKVLQPDF
jgi:flavin-dependent dehydrogenase